MEKINKLDFYESWAGVIEDSDSITMMLRSTELHISIKGSTQILINELAETLYTTFEDSIMGITCGMGILTVVSDDYSYLRKIKELTENAIIYYGISR